jgi:hypothetical protein
MRTFDDPPSGRLDVRLEALLLIKAFAVKRTQLYPLDDRPRDLATRPRLLDLPDLLTQVFKGWRTASSCAIAAVLPVSVPSSGHPSRVTSSAAPMFCQGQENMEPRKPM